MTTYNKNTRMTWKRALAYPLAAIVNCINRASKNGRLILHLPNWQNNFPSWTSDIKSSVVVNTVHGFDILCDVNDYLGRHIIIDRDWEPLIGDTIKACVPSGGICIDIGANIGFHSLIMSQAAGDNGRVYAFEPNLYNLEVLLGNLHRNNIVNTCVISLALGEHGGIGHMTMSSTSNCGSANLRDSDRKHGQPVLLTHADALRLVEEGETISLIKLDVEGLEEKVLCGLGKLLNNVQYLICEMSPEWNDTDSICAMMKAAGFKRLIALPAMSNLPIHKGRWLQPAKHSIPGQHDALFYRELSPALQKLVIAD